MAERYVDAAFSDGVNTGTFFLTDQYVVYDYGGDRVLDGVHPLSEFPVGTASGFPVVFAPPDPSTSMDAALRGKGPFVDFAYIFRGAGYMRLRTSSVPATFDPGAPQPLSTWNLPASFSAVDAAFNGALNREPFCYFFRGSQYLRYIWASDAVDAGYPKPISNLIGMPAPFTAGVDAAVDGARSFADASYLFKDENYVRFQWVSSGDPQADGGIKPIQGNWPGLAELLLAGKAKSNALEWLRVTRDRLTRLANGTLSSAEMAVVSLALATHFHIASTDTANLGLISTMFGNIEATLRDSARMFRYRTDAEAIADSVPTIDAAYTGPWPPSAATRINFTGNFLRRVEINRVSSVIHEAMHVNDATTDTPARHISEWYVSPGIAPLFGLPSITANNPAFGTRYDLMPASDAVHNPASYATFARHVFQGFDTREMP